MSGDGADNFPRCDSAAAVTIIDKDPFNTPWRLCRSWIGGEIPEYRSVSGSNRTREEYARSKGEPFIPVWMEHPENSWAVAEIDGINLTGDTILALNRNPGPRSHKMALDGQIPEWRWAQIQWELYICQTASRAEYWSYSPAGSVRFSVEPEVEFQQWMFEHARVFRNNAVKGIAPVGDAWKATAERWSWLKEQADHDKATLDILQSELDALLPAGSEKILADGVEVLRYTQKGQVDPTALCKGLNIQPTDLDRYRKPSSTRVRVARWKDAPVPVSQPRGVVVVAAASTY